MADKRIPEMEFINDVETFMKGKDVTATLQGLDERLSKYRFLELNLLQKRARLRRQLPDFEKSIEVIKLLEAKEELNTHFLMSSQLYSKARIPPTETVCLWLGANVMLEYPLEEARTLLAKNLSTSLTNLKQIEEDLEFLRDQITTTEVNLARVYNWNVKRLQADRIKSAGSSAPTTTAATVAAKSANTTAAAAVTTTTSTAVDPRSA